MNIATAVRGWVGQRVSKKQTVVSGRTRRAVVTGVDSGELSTLYSRFKEELSELSESTKARLSGFSTTQ